VLVLPAEPANAGLSGSFDNRYVNNLPADFAVGLLALFLSQFDQGFVGNRLYETVSQNA
jgi:hypothetical protein